MRFYASFSIAFGLVAASPCKPLASDSTAVSATSSPSSATGISSTFAESATSTVKTLATETSTAIDTTVTEASTLVGSTSAETTDVTISASEATSGATSAATTTAASTETTAVETSADTTTTGVTDTSIAETSVATTTAVETSTTAVATTTTSEEPAPTDHLLIAGPGPAQGLPLKSTGTSGNFLIFGDRTSLWTVGRFVVDPTTGYLTRDGFSVCAQYRYMNRNAALISCTNDAYQYGVSRLVCERNPAPGTALQCSAVKLNCVANGPGDSQACTVSTEANWTKFFVTYTSDYTVYLGADDLAVSYLTPVDIFVDRAPTAAAQTAP
ncbi:hypothetical protein FPCIR_4475 [Fusarium pseudocircinatum]|uniref:Uncharacterized protein n=1 Tax=Fusarium pseudocircinatum TaxID=56676 RepID=A0A8H5PEG3_9HYPO|nr:hypothetical protein FPCIR_4475 [Fusarium pseudocircinatum]